jgi:hypothetical protein
MRQIFKEFSIFFRDLKLIEQQHYLQVHLAISGHTVFASGVSQIIKYLTVFEKVCYLCLIRTPTKHSYSIGLRGQNMITILSPKYFYDVSRSM